MKEEMQVSQGDKGIVDKSLNAWQGWNKFTLAVGIGAVGVGAFLGMPLVVGIGATSAAIDGVQIYAIDKFKKWKNKEDPKIPSSGNIYLRSKAA